MIHAIGSRRGSGIIVGLGTTIGRVIAESLGELLDRCLAEGAFFAREGFEALRRLDA